jgi:hypothetical protein
MPHGLCSHNFASNPCEEHHECLRGCGDFHVVHGDTEQRAALLDLRRKQVAALEHSQRALLDKYFGAEKWVTSALEHLKGIDAALSFIGTAGEAPLGALVSVFPGAPSKLKELE